MSKENPFKYLNNILYGLKNATPILIQFYKNKNPETWAKANMKGGLNEILFEKIKENNLLPHINLKPYFDICDKINDLTYDETETLETKESLSSQKTLKNINKILELWSELYDKTLQLLLQELSPYYPDLKRLKGKDLEEYCFNLLDYDLKNYNPKFLINFLKIIKEITFQDYSKSA